MKYLDNLLWGKKENRQLILTALGIPADEDVLNDEAKGFPHLAYKDRIIRVWNVEDQVWTQILPASLNDEVVDNANIVYELADQYMIWKIAIRPDAGDTIRIGITDGGEEIMPDYLFPAGTWYSVTYDVFTNGANRNIYINGITDNTKVKIYKLPL